MTGESAPFDNALTAEIERLRFALQAATVGTWDYDFLTGQAQWSAICKKLFGLPADAEVTAEMLLQQVHPDDRERVGLAHARVLSPESDGKHYIRFRTLNPQGTLRWVEAKGQVLRGSQGEVIRFSGIVQEVTDRVLDRQRLEESENKLKTIIAAAPAGIGLFVGRDLLIEYPNQTFIDIVGKGPGVEGLPLREAMPELLSKGQPFLQILDEVYTTGEPFISPASLVRIVQNGVLNDNYYNISYTPIRNTDGEIYAILDIAIDVTDQVVAQQALQVSEGRFQNLIRDANVGMIVLSGDEWRITVVNEAYCRLIDHRLAETLNRPLFEVIPAAEGYFRPLLEQVKATGEPFSQQQIPYNVQGAQGETIQGFIDYVYQPYREVDGTITGVMAIVTDVTQQIQARHALEASEASLRNAVELAQLGTWRMDVATGQMIYSERLKRWLGVEEAVLGREASPRVAPKDRDRVSRAMETALEKGGPGRYDEVYTITHAITGQERIIHASGQTVFDTAGVALSLSGTVQDVTLQQQGQLALEQEVHQRTEELAAVNEELASTNEELLIHNEEYAHINERLEELNADLRRSNQNLEQFAYIASHDLQEPLRKIQQFGDLLTNQYGDQLGDGLDYLQRMQSAANRMSTLVRDLLTYSRIATQQETNESVSLTTVVQMVLTDLELRIEETGATLRVEPLPTVPGDALQLGQLFHNLLSNALKFIRRGELGKSIPPFIQIKAVSVKAQDLPTSIKPNRMVEMYHRIDVMDNGIGFDTKYLDRIFQVFQRLHGKSEFAGTGIGLAICEKVAANHGGTITASSQPGQGATFCVYLPA